jgi:hypothetical protein
VVRTLAAISKSRPWALWRFIFTLQHRIHAQNRPDNDVLTDPGGPLRAPPSLLPALIHPLHPWPPSIAGRRRTDNEGATGHGQGQLSCLEVRCFHFTRPPRLAARLDSPRLDSGPRRRMRRPDCFADSLPPSLAMQVSARIKYVCATRAALFFGRPGCAARPPALRCSVRRALKPSEVRRLTTAVLQIIERQLPSCKRSGGSTSLTDSLTLPLTSTRMRWCRC